MAFLIGDRISVLFRWGLALALAAGLILFSTSGARAAAPPRRDTNDLFSTGYVGRLKIEIPREGLASLRRNPRAYVRATVREGAVTYANVAIHLKGAIGSFRPVDDNPALTLNFGKFAEGQTFHGFKKIHLNNSVQDSTLLNEKLSRDLFNAAGVPAARAAHATVEFNGENLGLRVMVEGLNKQFLKRHFANANGTLFEGGLGRDVSLRMRVNEGEDPANTTGLKALVAAVREPDLEARRAKMEKALDVDRFLSFMAMEIMLAHWDGYTMGVNNYRIFHDLGAGKMVFIPHGTDQVLGNSNMSAKPEARGMVARAVLEVPEFEERYFARVTSLLTNVFVAERITNSLWQTAERMRPFLGNADDRAGRGFDQRVSSVCRRVIRREQFLRKELLEPTHRLIFDAQGSTPLKEWQPAVMAGEASLSERDQGKSLCIEAQESCSATWRNEIVLGPGRYRFTGRVKISGVEIEEGDARGGVCLRMSRRSPLKRLTGTRDWTELSFDFTVEQSNTRVDLICELRGRKGTACFDLASLHLRRL